MAYDFCEILSVEGMLCAIPAGYIRYNHGGMNEAIFLPESYIISFPEYSFSFDENKAAQLTGSIILRAGATGYRFRFTRDTGNFSEPMQENDDGPYYDQLFAISIPKDRPEITWLKQRMSRPRYALLYRDANGITKALRNLRVKMDLNTGRKAEEYNGHILYARKASELPAMHWNISPSSALETIFTVSSITLATYATSLAEGWQVGKKIQLPYTPINSESVVAIYNNVLHLRLGTDFTVSGDFVTLNFADIPDGGGPGELTFFFAANRIASDISGFVQDISTKTSSYSSGETIVLPSSPADDGHLLITMNHTVALRRGVDYTLSGNTITLLFPGTPSGGDPDTFHCFYATSGSALDIAGWKNYRHNMPTGLTTGSQFTLPHTPLANSLLLWYDGHLLLEPGVHYNLNTDEVTIQFDTAAKSSIDAWYAY